ncbi:hypothetical protein MES5069_60063 [Mesorhizobium escarrei]|uniref:Uncharacterized protein n=1 Tax=Mesorhizobium escarrei TaxID=666018 RepID=A0ABN8KAX0_9HYPH|nr:hypothetical protein MES5069_60063 [Mesorhizobium escarrei]
MAQPLLRPFGDGPCREIDGKARPASDGFAGSHPRHQAILKSLALQANPWDDAFG